MKIGVLRLRWKNERRNRFNKDDRTQKEKDPQKSTSKTRPAVQGFGFGV